MVSCTHLQSRAVLLRGRAMIILASASPRRKEILGTLGVEFEVVVADADERSVERDPRRYAEQISARKGLAVLEKLRAQGRDISEVAIISADTVVCRDGEILGKPRDEAEAYEMISSLSGREHEVVTGVSVTVAAGVSSASALTRVRVAEIPKSEIEKYVASKDPMDKAGAYGIQGSFSMWVEGIDGCYFNVVGLPVNTLARLYYDVTGKRIV